MTALKAAAKYENLGIVFFKTIAIISQGKAFCRQTISQSICARKDTADIDILKTPKKGDRKIMQPITITSGSENSAASSDEHLPKQYQQKRLRMATFRQ